MRHHVRRTYLSTLVALALVTASPGSVVGSGWSTACGTTHGACIYAHQSFGLPRTGASGSVEEYVGNYYNSDITRNNSASSVKNLFGAKDVNFYHDDHYKGFVWCVDSGATAPDLGWLDNDAFSSHIVFTHDNAC